MSARERILARIREKSGRSGETSEAELEAARAHIALRLRGPQPAIASEPAIARFKHESERLKSSVATLASVADVPREVARYLDEIRVEKTVVGWPAFTALPWSHSHVRYLDHIADGDDLVGLTGCFCAIGETGTLLLLSSPTTPKLTALLPETHICVVNKDRIVPTMEDAFQLLRDEKKQLPRATFFVSGPSRTADIEQTIVIGAHGPYRVHVIVVP